MTEETLTTAANSSELTVPLNRDDFNAACEQNKRLRGSVTRLQVGVVELYRCLTMKQRKDCGPYVKALLEETKL